MLSVDPGSEASTVTLPRQRFAGDVVVEEAAGPVDVAGLPVEVVQGPVWPAPPPRYEMNSSSVGPGYRSPEEAVQSIFEQHGPEVARRPVSGGGVVEAAPVEPEFAAEELPPVEAVPMSPLVERLLYGSVRCGGCLAAWPCGHEGYGHGPYVPGEDVGVSGEPDPAWFLEVAAGRPFGPGQLGQALAAVKADVLAAVERCEVATRKLGAARRAERFAGLCEELEGVFALAAAGGLPVFAEGGPVDSPVDAEHGPNGNVLCEFVVRGEPALEDDADGDGEEAGGDPTGLTVPCDDECGDKSPHDAHLADGALERLGAAGQGGEGVGDGQG